MTDLSGLDDALLAARKSGDWREAVRLCRQAVGETENAGFRDWFFFRMQLARCLLELETEPAIEEGITVCYDLLHGIPQTRDSEIGLMHMLMGNLYKERHDASEEENCRLAIVHYSQTLEYPNAKLDPLIWASVVTSIGFLWARLRDATEPPERPPETVAAQLREAIRIFNERQCPEEAAEATEALEKIEHVSSAPKAGG